jgi:hypothetical protein
MVQGGKNKKAGNNTEKLNSKAREKQETKKRKAGENDFGRNGKIMTEEEKSIHKKVDKHHKKIYRSIESTIIQNAKKNRERFEIV